MRVLIVLTSHDKLGETGAKTGFWYEEFAAPYYYLKDAGAAITLASPKGGLPPMDPKSNEPEAQTDATRRFDADADARRTLAHTRALSQLNPADFDAVFYPGGHGPIWDLSADTDSIALIESFVAANKPVASVCHGPAVLVNARNPAGKPVVAGRRVTGFSNSEETAVGLNDVVPFLLENKLSELGGHYEKADNWNAHVVVDGPLITGQNPASSEAVADALIHRLK